MLGYTQEELLNKCFYELLEVNNEQLENIKNIVRRRLVSEVFCIELKEHIFLSKQKTKIPVSIFAYSIQYNGKPSGLVVVFNKTKEKAYEKLFFALSQINQLIIRQENQDELLKKVCDILVNRVGYSFCAVGKIENKAYKPIYAKAQNKNMLEEINSINIKIKSQNICKCSISKAFYSKNVSLISDVSNMDSCALSFFNKFNIHSSCAVPILKGSKVVYIILIFDSIVNIFTEEYLYLLREIQQDLNFALKKIEDEKFNHLAFTAINQGYELVIIADKNFKIIFVNEKFLQISGYTKQEIIGKNGMNFFVLEKPRSQRRELKDVLKSNNLFFGVVKLKLKNKVSDYYLNVFAVNFDQKSLYYVAVAKELAKEDEIKNELYKLSHYDATTGFINHETFIYSVELFLERAKKQNQIGAIAIVNPIQFKNINHAFGYDVGNKMLQKIAQRLKDNSRQYDIVAKLESDRFGVLLKDLKTQEDALIVVMKLLNMLSKPYEIGKEKVSMSFNIGLSLFPKDGSSVKDLIDKAQIALADAKSKGENQVGFFRKEIEQDSSKKLKLKAELEQALLNKEFVVYYQPYVDKNKKIVGAEALLRWEKNDNVLLPSEFLSILEETSLIINVEDAILSQVLGFIKEFDFMDPIPISINLSIQSLMQKHLSENIISNLKYMGINESLLKIEIIERAFLNDFNYIKILIDELSQKGVYFALDDFGTGYSSLSYLTKLKVEFLKIDISFTRNLKNSQTKNVVSAIIYLAKSLNIKTIAEGVENNWQFETLKTMGCDYFQGFLFYQPMPKNKFFEMLKVKGGIL